MSRVALIGGSGVLGRHVLRILVTAGLQVRLLTRSEVGILASDDRVESVVGDVLDRESLSPLLRGCDAAVHVATALRIEDGASRPDWARNDAVRIRGTTNLIDACAREGVGRLVAQSVAFVASPSRDAWSAGTEPLAPLGFLRSASVMEQLLRSAPFACAVLRGGLFYGEGTGVQAEWESAASARAFNLPRSPLDFVSLIHVEDMARAVVAALTSRLDGCYPVVDDEPVRWQDLFSGLAAECGAPPPAHGDWDSLPSFRVSNRATRLGLGWQPRFRSYRDGWRTRRPLDSALGGRRVQTEEDIPNE